MTYLVIGFLLVGGGIIVFCMSETDKKWIMAELNSGQWWLIPLMGTVPVALMVAIMSQGWKFWASFLLAAGLVVVIVHASRSARAWAA
jgi:hypothetical protein